MISSKRGAALLVASLVLLSAVAGMGVMGAAPSVDTETSNTATTSELTDAGTQEYNATTSTYLNWSADSNNSSLTIMQDGRTLMTASPNAETSVDTGSDGNPDLWYYNQSLADDGSDYAAIEAGANEDVTITAEFANNTEVDSPDTSNITYTFSNGEERAFVAGTSEDTEIEADDDGIMASVSSLGGILGNDSDPGAARVTDTTNVTSNTSEIVVDVEQTDAVDSLSHVTEESDEGLTMMGYAMVDGEMVPMFVGSADADWLDTDEDTYVVVDSSGESATVHNPGVDSEDATELDVELTANDKPGYSSVSMLRDYGAGWTTALTAGDIVDIGGTPEFEEV